jgi:putative spermidine/putrescine transport system substrate-binding protein
VSPLNRREFVRIAATGSAALAAGCSRTELPSRQLVVTDPGGEWQQAAVNAYYAPFEAETGIAISYSARPALGLGRLKAMAEAGNPEWDLTVLTDYLMHRGARDGLIEPIDARSLKVAGLISSGLMSHGIGNDVFATVFAYNTNKWPRGQGPRTWADFWDVQRFPGRRAMSGIGYGPLEFALLADGVPAASVYPIDQPRALAKMSEIKPHVRVWWNAGAQQSQLMLRDEVDLIMGWNARMQSAIDQGAPFAIEWNQGMYQIEGWAIPKGAKRRAEALRLIDFALRADRQAEFVKQLPYGPVNPAALTQIPSARAAQLPTFDENLGKMFVADAAWISEHVDALQNVWTSWKVQ